MHDVNRQYGSKVQDGENIDKERVLLNVFYKVPFPGKWAVIVKPIDQIEFFLNHFNFKSDPDLSNLEFIALVIICCVFPLF